MSQSMGAGASHGRAHDKVNICHSTNSATNPYVFITVSSAAVPAHQRHHDGRDIIGVQSEADCPNAKPACPAGYTPYTIHNLANGTYGNGDLSVTLSGVGPHGFTWTASTGVDEVITTNKKGAMTAFSYWDTTSATTSIGNGQPLKDATFCYQHKYIRLCEDAFICPLGMDALTVDAPAAGSYSDGWLQVWLSNNASTGFHWNSNVGIDAVLLVTDNGTCNYWNPEFSSNDVTTDNGAPIRTAVFCYDKEGSAPGQ